LYHFSNIFYSGIKILWEWLISLRVGHCLTNLPCNYFPALVHRLAPGGALFHVGQLLLDVLRGSTPAPGARCGKSAEIALKSSVLLLHGHANLRNCLISLHSLWVSSVHGRCDSLQPLTWQWFSPTNLSESKSQLWPAAFRLRQAEMSGVSGDLLTQPPSILQVFVKDTIVMRWFMVISWLSPIPIAVVYGLARHFSSPDNKQ